MLMQCQFLTHSFCFIHDSGFYKHTDSEGGLAEFPMQVSFFYDSSTKIVMFGAKIYLTILSFLYINV